MDKDQNNVQRYRARAARRPVLFWWQAFFLLGVTLLLWSRLPMSAILYETRVFPSFPEPHAAYVVLDPSYAKQALKQMRMSWGASDKSGKAAGELELGTVDIGEPLPPPAFLEQGAVYPGHWHPAAPVPLPYPVPDLRVSAVPDTPVRIHWPAVKPGLRVTLDGPLTTAGFSFPKPADALPESTGSCRFYLETDTDGSVSHVLLLSPRNDSAAILERSLARGQAKGPVRGFMTLAWSFPQ